MLFFLFVRMGSASIHVALYRTVTEQPICTGPTGPAGIFAFHLQFHKYSKTFRLGGGVNLPVYDVLLTSRPGQRVSSQFQQDLHG